MTEADRQAYRIHTALYLRISRLQRLLDQSRKRNDDQQRIIDQQNERIAELTDPVRRAACEFDRLYGKRGK